MFPFLCPSRGQLPPVGWGRSVVITYLDNRCAAQRGRTLVEQRSPAVPQRSAAPKTPRRQPPDRPPTGWQRPLTGRHFCGNAFDGILFLGLDLLDEVATSMGVPAVAW